MQSQLGHIQCPACFLIITEQIKKYSDYGHVTPKPGYLTHINIDI